jgi:phenylacetate-CoA ligase
VVSFGLKRRVYDALPDAIRQPLAWIPFRYVAGPSYRRTFDRGRELDRAPRSELLAYQERELGRMLAFAVDQVPAYRALRATVARLAPFEALRAFPLLSKDDLQADMARFLPRDFERIPHYECTTGGTTGNQLKFYVDNDSQSVELAFLHRQWARVGYTPARRKATFRGVHFPRRTDGCYWQSNPVYNELQFSPFHMNDATLDRYWERLVRYRPAFLHGYPSAIALLAGFLKRRGLARSYRGLEAVLLGSEALEPDDKDEIETAFGARAYSWYGHSERVVLGGECEKSPSYHHFADYGVLEILDADARDVAPGERGEIVGTGLTNRSLPLIRYRTGDRARRLEPRCACGRALDRFDGVEGRWKREYVIGRNGSRISPAALNMHGPFFDRVRRYQYYQSVPGRMELRVVIAPGFGAEDSRALLEAFREKTGDELEVELRVVDDIPLTERGKLRRLIQEIPGIGAPPPRG